MHKNMHMHINMHMHKNMHLHKNIPTFLINIHIAYIYAYDL